MSFLINERGVLLPAALVLLLIVTAMLFNFLVNYDAKYRTYDSLETYYHQKTQNVRLPFTASIEW